MRTVIAAALVAAAFTGMALGQEPAPPLPFDSPVLMRAMEAVCTGIGADARNDPRWPSYPLRVELVGRAGEYLGEATVSLTKGDEAIISVRCAGPWVLIRLPPGMYDVTAVVEGVSKNAKANVAAAGQARVILRFPELGAIQAK